MENLEIFFFNPGCFKYSDGIMNSVNPEQTVHSGACCSGLTWFYIMITRVVGVPKLSLQSIRKWCLSDTDQAAQKYKSI